MPKHLLLQLGDVIADVSQHKQQEVERPRGSLCTGEESKLEDHRLDPAQSHGFHGRHHLLLPLLGGNYLVDNSVSPKME